MQMLTPMDIEKKKFSKRFRGYDDVDVDEFLNLVIADYEKLYKENSLLKDKNAMIIESLGKYKTIEETMQNTLIAAQSTGDEIKRNATQKAENIIKEAELIAKETIERARNEQAAIELRLVAAKRELETFKIKAVSALSAQLSLLESIKDQDVRETVIEMPKEEFVAAFVEEEKEAVAEEQKEVVNKEVVEEIKAYDMETGLYEEDEPEPKPEPEKSEPEITFSKRNFSYDMIKENMLKNDM